MKIVRFWLIFLFLLGLTGGFYAGCGPAPYCETSLVTMDEMRLDTETYEEEAADTAEKVAELEQKLAAKKKDLELIEGKPAELEEKVKELKKGSGRE